MRNLRRSFRRLIGATFLVALAAVVPSIATAHDNACHTDHTCPSDTTPPTYQCGDNPLQQCSLANAPDTTQPNPAPQLNGPPTAADCQNDEIFYVGSICKQVLGVGSPAPSGANLVPTPEATLTPFPIPSDNSFPIPSPLTISNRGFFASAASSLFVALALYVFFFACCWRIFTKAVEPGWAALVPIYNLIVYLKIAGRPVWWILIIWLIVPAFIVNIDLAKRFGQSTGFGVGLSLLPPVFLPILAFGDAHYRRRDTGERPLPL